MKLLLIFPLLFSLQSFLQNLQLFIPDLGKFFLISIRVQIIYRNIYAVFFLDLTKILAWLLQTDIDNFVFSLYL